MAYKVSVQHHLDWRPAWVVCSRAGAVGLDSPLIWPQALVGRLSRPFLTNLASSGQPGASSERIKAASLPHRPHKASGPVVPRIGRGSYGSRSCCPRTCARRLGITEKSAPLREAEIGPREAARRAMKVLPPLGCIRWLARRRNCAVAGATCVIGGAPARGCNGLPHILKPLRWVWLAVAAEGLC